MLQIATGKLFTGPVFRENQLTGTLFSNAAKMFEPLVTKAGTVQWTNALRVRTPSMTYHVTEAIEGGGPSEGLVISYGVDSYLQDFSSLMTFHLGIICSPDAELVARLTRGRPGPATKAAPNELIRGQFDPIVSTLDGPGFSVFVAKLLGLPRAQFRQVMQAIRTLVTGIHRMGDDLEVAYALMVAALESLASGAGSSQTTWEDLPASKRDPIDIALEDVSASPEVCEAVRTAISKTEHGAKLLKFKAFIQDTVPPSFFREDGLGQARPVGKLDFKDALDTAYDLRSSYVHALTPLPDQVTRLHNFADIVALEDRSPCLTFQGLLRVSKAVILAYVDGQPQIEKEPCDYTRDIPNLTQVQLAPSALMYPDRIRADNGKEWLENFIEAWDDDVLGSPTPTMADLKPSLDRAVALMPQMKAASRRSYAALVFAVRMTMPESIWATMTKKVYEDQGKLFIEPSAEALLLHTLAGIPPEWALADHEAEVLKHLKTRRRPSGVLFPDRIEASIVLDLAERFRVEGQWDRTQHYLNLAAENWPRFERLRHFQASATPDQPIQWFKVLVQAQPDGELESGGAAP